MSDGPHRCLKMRKAWKHAARAADAAAFDDEEVAQWASHALQEDWAQEVPAKLMKALRECFGAGDQMQMIPPTVEAVSALRELAPGLALAAKLLDCAEDAAVQGLAGHEALNQIASSALEDRVNGALRHIQETYQRESTDGRAKRVLARVTAPLRRAASQLAGNFVRTETAPKAVRVTRSTGIDEGPRL